MLGFLVIVVVGLLVVNYFRNLDTGEPFPEGIATEETETGPETYTVAAGESLWTISEKVYGTGYNWVDIKEANDLEQNALEEGQELIIPNLDETEETMMAEATNTPEVPIPTATIEPTPEPDPTPEATVMAEVPENKSEQVETAEAEHAQVNAGGSYTVVRGDNLWKIAEAAYGDGYQWVQIAEANNLANPSIIHAGNVLTIPTL